MQVIITTGHPRSGYQLVHKVLERGGVQSAHKSRREGLTPEAMSDRILRAHNSDDKRPEFPACNEIDQVRKDLAGDLFLNNSNQINWGWADASATWLLDFWLRFDARVRFVFVYSAPAAMLADLMLDADTNVDLLTTAVQSWIRWNSELLRFSVRHPQRCLLVNSIAVLRCPKSLIDSANDLLDLRLTGPSDDEIITESSGCALASFLANALLEESNEARALYDELKSAAHLYEDHTDVGSVAVRLASDEYLASRLNLQQLCARLGEAQQTNELVEDQKSQLLLRNTVLLEENELLFQQLRQLQDALAQTELAYRESDKQRVELASRPATVLPTCAKGNLMEIALDLRQEIDGSNWYWAEHDGRWAGPGTCATLRVPNMGPGRFELTLDIVDTIEPEILDGMQVALCGISLALAREVKSLPASLKRRSFPMRLKGVAMIEAAGASGYWDISFAFPSVSSPALRGSNDTRLLAIRLRSLRLRALQVEGKDGKSEAG